MRRRRFREWAKWACTLAAGAMVVLALFSGFYSVNFSRISVKQQRSAQLFLAKGLLCIADYRGPLATNAQPGKKWEVHHSGGWYWGRSSEMAGAGTRWPWSAGLLSYEDSRGWALGMSLIYPVLITTLPAALLWYADRRRLRPGSCGGCGYDRRGLAAGATCPECGTAPIA